MVLRPPKMLMNLCKTLKILAELFSKEHLHTEEPKSYWTSWFVHFVSGVMAFKTHTLLTAFPHTRTCGHLRCYSHPSNCLEIGPQNYPRLPTPSQEPTALVSILLGLVCPPCLAQTLAEHMLGTLCQGCVCSTFPLLYPGYKIFPLIHPFSFYTTGIYRNHIT